MDESETEENKPVVEKINDPRIQYHHTKRYNDYGYTVKEEGAKIATGDFLCFPPDDVYYVPVFLEVMLAAITQKNLDLAYCNFVFDKLGYIAIEARAEIGGVSVGGFLVKKEKFTGWFDKTQLGDGRTVVNICKDSNHGRVQAILYVTN